MNKKVRTGIKKKGKRLKRKEGKREQIYGKEGKENNMNEKVRTGIKWMKKNEKERKGNKMNIR